MVWALALKALSLHLTAHCDRICPNELGNRLVESVRLDKQSTRVQDVLLNSKAKATAPQAPSSEISAAVPSLATRNMEVWSAFSISVDNTFDKRLFSHDSLSWAWCAPR